MRRLFLLLLLLSTAYAGIAQCTNSTSYGSLTAPIIINGTATLNTLNPGEYTTVNACVSGYVYKMTSTVATDYFTVHSGTFNGPVVISGHQPLNFTTSTSGTYYVHLNSNATCGTTQTAAAHNVTITLVEKSATPSGCINTSQTSIGMTAPGVIGGTSTVTLVTTGRYTALAAVVGGNYYKITTPLATNYISVRSGSYNGTIVAAGTQPLSFMAPVSGTYYVHTNTDANCGTNNSYGDLTTTRIYPFCTGTPSLGSAMTSNAGPVCPATSFNLSVNPTQEVSGVTYQWEVSTTGASGPFTAIAGKNEATSSIAGQEQSSWYRLAGICTGSNQSAVSEAIYVSQQAAVACYCMPTYQYNNQYGYINSVQLGTINNVTGRNAAAPNNYYSYTSAPAANQTTDLAQGSSQTIIINVAGAASQNNVAAWVDYNADGDFTDPGEQLGTATRLYNVDVSFSFTVPPTAVPGPTRLRVREAYTTGSVDPCNTISGYGETEDYIVTIVVPPACTESEYITYYSDGDGDGFGDASTTTRACPDAPPTGFVTNSTDCNDGDVNLHSAVTYYKDFDNDGFGNATDSITECSSTAPTGYVSDNTDCYDTDPSLNPNTVWYLDFDQDGYYTGAGITSCLPPTAKGYRHTGLTGGNDCNDNDIAIHEPVQYYIDGDHDGYGTTTIALVCSSTATTGYSTNSTDCNDDDATIHEPVQYYVDSDHDGFGSTTTEGICAAIPPLGYSTNNTDCDDDDATVHVPQQYYVDGDHDGYGSTTTEMLCVATAPTGYATNKTDCDDNNAAVHAPQQYYVDGDHDGFGSITTAMLCETTAPEGYSTNNTDCDDGNAAVHVSHQFYVDGDKDGYGSETTAMLCESTAPTGYSTNNTDCNDNDVTVHAPQQYYVDADGDGYGSTLTALVCSSIVTTGYSTNNTDCNDLDGSIHAPKQYYVDADHDGYGSTATEMLCASSAPLGYATNNTDCNDADATSHAAKQYYVDGDRDGYGSTTTAMLCAATAPVGYSTNNTDCNDNDAAVYANCGPCKNSASLSTTNITTTSATMNWVANSNPAQWQVQYKSTNQGAKWVDVLLAGTVRSYTLTGLKANQNYQWHIRAKCGTKWTGYSTTISFKTKATILSTITTNSVTLSVKTEAQALEVKALPNPSTTYFTLIFKSSSDTSVSLRIVDAVGRTVEGRTGVASNSTLRVGHTYRPGVYFAQVVQGNKIVTVKLVKQTY